MEHGLVSATLAATPVVTSSSQSTIPVTLTVNRCQYVELSTDHLQTADLKKLQDLADRGDSQVRWPSLGIEAYGLACDHMGFILDLQPADGSAPEHYAGMCRSAGFSQPFSALMALCLTQSHRQVVLGSHLAPTPGIPIFAWQASELSSDPQKR